MSGRFERRVCTRCGRTIAVNADGEMRTHFCPHREPCAEGRCRECRDTAAAAHAADTPIDPSSGA